MNSDAFIDIAFNSANVVAFTTTIHHPEGIAKSGDFGAFNLGLHVGDDANIVNHNRATLLSKLPAQSQIQWLNQVHGIELAQISTPSTNPITADGQLTSTKGAALAIMTADCLPVLLAAKSGDEIAALHCGWRP